MRTRIVVAAVVLLLGSSWPRGVAAQASCDDSNDCTEHDVCAVNGDCSGVQKVDLTPCTPNPFLAACTTSAVCISGFCVPMGSKDDDIPCTVPGFTDLLGACLTSATCKQGACNLSLKTCTSPDDKCSVAFCSLNDGECHSIHNDCDDGCSKGTCDTNTGNCINLVNKPDTTTCDDGNDCTAASHCQAGNCVGGAASTPLPTATPTTTVSVLPTSSPTHTLPNQPTFTETPTVTPTATSSATATNSPGTTPTVAPCASDCNMSGTVTESDLLIGVQIALGHDTTVSCGAADRNHDERVTVDELLAAVNTALVGCPQLTPTPSETVVENTPTPTTVPATATLTATPEAPTATSTSTSEPTETLTPTLVPASPTQTAPPSATPSPTGTEGTATPSQTKTSTETPTETPTPSETETEGEATPTATGELTPATPSETETPTPSETATEPEATPTATSELPAATDTPTATPTATGGSMASVAEHAAGGATTIARSLQVIPELISGLFQIRSGSSALVTQSPLQALVQTTATSCDVQCTQTLPPFSPRNYSAHFAQCVRTTSTGGSLEINGDLTAQSTDPGVCNLPPTSLTFTLSGLAVTEKDAQAMTVFSATFNLSGSADLTIDFLSSCLISKADLTLSGTAMSGGALGETLDFNQTHLVVDLTQFDDSCTALQVSDITIDGTITVSGAAIGGALAASFDQFVLTDDRTSGNDMVALNGTVGSPCLGTPVMFTTNTDLDFPPGSVCPNAGEILLTYGAGVSDKVTYSSGEVDIDLGNDNSTELMFPGCSVGGLLCP